MTSEPFEDMLLDFIQLPLIWIIKMSLLCICVPDGLPPSPTTRLMPSQWQTLLEIVFLFCKNSSQIDKCLYRLLLFFCPMLAWPATVSLQCLVLEPIIDKLRKLPKTAILGILLVTVQKLLTGCSRSITREWQPQALMKGTSSNSHDHWHCCKTMSTELWMHNLQLKKAPPDIWSCTNVRDPQIKLTTKRSSWHHVDCCRSRHPIKTCYFI